MTEALAAWLRDLGLERYEQAFRDNAIDAEVLPALTDADLEKLGVLLGHRKPRRGWLRLTPPEPLHRCPSRTDRR